MLNIQKQYDHDYHDLRMAVLRGEVTAERAKTWIRAHAVIVTTQLEDQMPAYKEMLSSRAGRDIEGLMKDEEE